jgi:hypothetical protein
LEEELELVQLNKSLKRNKFKLNGITLHLERKSKLNKPELTLTISKDSRLPSLEKEYLINNLALKTFENQTKDRSCCQTCR